MTRLRMSDRVGWGHALLILLACCTTIKGDWIDPVHGVDFWKNDWRQRSIYMVQTDRFDALDNPINECTALRDLTKYCGGTWEAMERRLDYLKGMNFDALMLSPTIDQTPGGYHGYWPSDLYSVNSKFGTQEDLQSLISKFENNGMRVMMDIVANHMGYGDFSYFNPFNQPDHFHGCGGCGHFVYWDCSIPPNLTIWQNRNCRLAGLYDLDQSNPDVLTQLLDWIQWMRGRYGFTGMRLDAISNLDPWFATRITQAAGLFAIGELPTASDTIEGALAPLLDYGNLTAGLALFDFFSLDPMRNVFYGEWRCYDGFGEPWNGLGSISCSYDDAMDPFRPLPLRSLRRLPALHEAFVEAGIDQSFLARFLDNPDFKRVLAINPSTAVLRNALTYLFLNEGIPVLYYGTEQEVTGIPPNLNDFDSRQPLWLTGFDQAKETYRFVRMLNWYRWKMGLWDLPWVEAYVDDNHFAFTRGDNFLVVVTNGLGALEPLLYLSNLKPGVTLCNVLGDRACLTADMQGNASVSYIAGGELEPMIFVEPALVRSDLFFVPVNARTIEWQPALIVTCCAAAGAVITAFLLYYVGRYLWQCCGMRLPDVPDLTTGPNIHVSRPALEDGDGGKAVKPSDIQAQPTSLADQELLAELFGTTAWDIMGTDMNNDNDNDIMTTEMGDDILATNPNSSRLNLRGMAGGMTTNLSTIGLDALLDEPAPKTEPVSAWNRVRNFTKVLSGMELHVALEYSVPHLGHTSCFMYGGLGKMVDIFIRHADRPIAVCAPMYSAFYEPGGGYEKLQPILSFNVDAGPAKHQVDVLTTMMEDKVAFFLLQCDIFKEKNRSTIYQFPDEESQLIFLSVYNQAVSRVISALGFQAVQLHDYHGAASLLYLPPASRPRVLYVAHNSDYNGVWPLGTKERSKTLYTIFNLPINKSTCRQFEHEGNLNMLKVIVDHINVHQSGQGVIAVSPRYALRIVRKFSVLWDLPKERVQGILNAIDGLPEPPMDLDALLEEKKQAKLQFQRQNGLLEGEEYQMLTFIGRLTHQKGSDLLAGAAAGILARNPLAQMAVAGPVGDWNGNTAQRLLKIVAATYPGRVYNAAGTYIEGESKELLSLATDFFLCPSRFEPCGLTDIEFGRAGALIIGHNTGGLGKMPGFYFEENLDNADGLSNRLVVAATQAMKVGPQKRLAMVKDAVQKDFPPSVMVETYRAAWDKIWEASETKIEPVINAPEAGCYNKLWQSDNLPFDAGLSVASVAKKWRSYAINLVLIVMQTMLQLPALFTFVWYLVNQGTGSIEFSSDALRTWSNIAGQGFQVAFTLFVVYGCSGMVWQALAFMVRGRTYLVIASVGYLVGSLAALWSTYIVKASFAMTVVTFATAPACGPLIGYIFLDQRNRISVSDWGPALMGLSDGVRLTVLFFAMLAILLNDGKDISALAYQCVAAGMLVTAVWMILFTASFALPSVFRYYQLRIRHQAGALIKHRKTWYALVAVSGVDSFSMTLIASAIYAFHGQHTLRVFSTLYFGVGAVAIICVAYFLTRQIWLQVPVLNKMYALALLPGTAVAQMACVLWGNNVWVIIAGTVFQIGIIRFHMVGILTLHTLSSREMLSGVLTLQTLVGSVGIGLGGFVGYLVGQGQTAIWWNLGLTIFSELARVVIVGLLIYFHRREHIAMP